MTNKERLGELVYQLTLTVWERNEFIRMRDELYNTCWDSCPGDQYDWFFYAECVEERIAAATDLHEEIETLCCIELNKQKRRLRRKR